MDDCIFDVVITDDVNFAQQRAFQIGKLILFNIALMFRLLMVVLFAGMCENDCSNHGDCVNGTCLCTGLWSGTDCSQGTYCAYDGQFTVGVRVLLARRLL